MEDSLRRLCNTDLAEQRVKVRTEIIHYINDFRKGNTDFSLFFNEQEEKFWDNLIFDIKRKKYKNAEEFTRLLDLNYYLKILGKNFRDIESRFKS